MSPSPLKRQQSSVTSSPAASDQNADEGTSVVHAPVEEGFNLEAFRESEEGKKLISWALNEFGRSRGYKTRKHRLWYTFMSFHFGHQWINILSEKVAGDRPIKAKAAPPYMQRRTVNRIRSFVRTEQSKFLSTLPSVTAVPATSEEEDIRAAYAAEQVVESYFSKRKLRREYSKATFWKILTGTGFLKVWWDPAVVDQASGQPGDVMYRSISPYHIFVPDLREQEVDDQPYIIQAQVKPLEWVRQQYSEELKGQTLTPTQSSTNTLLDESFYTLSDSQKSELDAVVILEVWVKAGTHPQLPEGGLLIFAGEVLVGAYMEGMPYAHGQYPYVKFEHLSNDTFFADSPLADLIELQKEFNDVRTQIGVAAKRMGNPQLLAQQGSIVPGRVTNEPGQIIQYRPGTPPPSPIPLQPLPEYVVNQVNQVVQDFEDLSGQHEVSKGSTPTGVTAGTALAFLKETDDNYLTPQYQNVEDGFERVAYQTLSLFQQYVDVARRVKVVGADGAFDSALLAGSDINGATDIRVEPGSSIGQSQAAKRAAVMDMFSVGILQDPNQALRLLEVGGAQKVLDTISVAEKKAQRENTKIKSLKTDEGQQMLEEHMQQHVMEMVQDMAQSLSTEPDPDTGEMPMGSVDPMELMQNPEVMQVIQEQVPPFIPADDFDMHEIHIDVHNRYRMGQEYETLPDAVKAEFDKHVEMHKMLLQQTMMEQLMMGGGMPPMEGEEPGGSVEGPGLTPDTGGPGIVGPAPAQPASL